MVDGVAKHAYRQTSLGKRFVDVLSPDNIAHESKVGYTTLTKFVEKQILKDAELVKSKEFSGAVWHFFRSAVTGQIGPSQPLVDLINSLKDKGINIDYIIYNK